MHSNRHGLGCAVFVHEGTGPAGGGVPWSGADEERGGGGAEGSGVEVVCSERTDTAEECGDEQEVRGVGRTAKGGRFRVLCAEGTGECGDVSRPIHEGIGRH